MLSRCDKTVLQPFLIYFFEIEAFSFIRASISTVKSALPYFVVVAQA